MATYEFWLKAGIILLGARFILGDIARLGGISLGLVFVELALALSFMTWLGRRFHLGPQLTTLLAVGSSVCGVSAIIATQGTIDADEHDSSTAIAAILALGAISLFAFPLIGHALHMSDHAYGLWAGLAVDNTAEAAAAGALYSDAAGKFAVLAKTCRNAMIGFVVLGYAIQWARNGLANATTESQLNHKAAFLWNKFPKFVLGFLFISLLATLGSSHSAGVAQLGFTKPQLTVLGNLSRWAFLLTFAGVGLRTNLRDSGDRAPGPLSSAPSERSRLPLSLWASFWVRTTCTTYSGTALLPLALNRLCDPQHGCLVKVAGHHLHPDRQPIARLPTGHTHRTYSCQARGN